MQVNVYPPQLNQLKSSALLFGQLIANESNTKKLSNFKSLDYFSQALGYKGHADLLYRATRRALGDNGSPVRFFSCPEISAQIIDTFISKLPSIKAIHIEKAAERMNRNALRANSTNPITNELSLSNQSGKSCLLPITREETLPQLLFDFSESTPYVAMVFMAHPRTKTLLKQFDTPEVFFDKKNPRGDSLSENWTINIYLDIWCKPQLSDDLLTAWNQFKEWAITFTDTSRVVIAERISDRRKKYLIKQMASNLEDLMQTAEDRVLLLTLTKPQMRPFIDEYYLLINH